MSRKPKTLYFIWGIFAVIGVIFVVVAGAVLFGFVQNKNERIETVATVVNREAEKTVIEYEIDGNVWQTRINEYSSEWTRGTKITVYVSTADPLDVRTNLMLLGAYIPGGIGLVFFIIGAIGLLVLTLGKRKAKNLIRNGRFIYGVVINERYNTSVHINGKSPIVLECRYDAPDGTVHIFKSSNIWHYIESVIGKPVRIYIADERMKKYYVDVDGLLTSSKIVYH